MKKERFIGYLEHMRDIAAEQYYSEDAEEVVDLLNEIIEKAEQLDEPRQTLPTYPAEPWWQKPWITWSPQTRSVDFDVDITDSICYNSKLPSVHKGATILPSNWKIIK